MADVGTLVVAGLAIVGMCTLAERLMIRVHNARITATRKRQGP